MSDLIAFETAHPEGESLLAPNLPAAPWPVDTPGDRVHAEWCDDAPVTREGSLIFFFQFLEAGGAGKSLSN